MKKLLVTMLLVLMPLGTISRNSCASTPNSIDEADKAREPERPKVEYQGPELGLQLPMPKIFKLKEGTITGWDDRGYNKILHIYIQYQLLSAEYRGLIQFVQQQQIQLQVMGEQLKLARHAIEVINNDRDTLYDLREQEATSQKTEVRKYKIKIALFAAGGVLVGAGIGILIGFLVPATY